jgi:hypothetical protein
MDLLLLVEEQIIDDTDKNRLLKKLFPATSIPKHPEYSLVEHKLKGLWLFLMYFWAPALKHFRDVLSKVGVTDGGAGVAIGEICHVLGITCRTQWMLNGFLCHHNSDPKIEYLPCRFDRVLSLLRRDPENKECDEVLRRFVSDISDIYSLLRSRYLQTEAVFADITTQIQQHVEFFGNGGDFQHPSNFYFQGTKHFLLRDSSFQCSEGMCEDPRTTNNVYLFALLDVS